MCKDKRKEGRNDAHDFEQPPFKLGHVLFEEIVACLCSTGSQITAKLDKKFVSGGVKLLFSHWSVDVCIYKYMNHFGS